MPAEVAPAHDVLEALAAEQVTNTGYPQHSQSTSTLSNAAVQRPRNLSDFDVLDLGSCGGLVSLRALVYPKGYTQLVGPADCVAWASSTGSRGTRWGVHGRVGEDDRVMLTMMCGFGAGAIGCAAHWYDGRGNEQTNPCLSCGTGQWRWTATYTNQTFVFRLMPQQQIALCGLKITARPYESNGHIFIMLLPSGSGSAEVLSHASQMMASLPEDDREIVQQRQGGRPNAPVPARHRRR